MRVLISGGSGLIGTALTRVLSQDGHEIARLVRPGGSASPGDVSWDPMSATIDVSAMEGNDVVVHLSGAGIAEKRWTPERKAVLRSSRIDSTRLLVDAIGHLRQKPRAFICASAIGFYGNRGDEILTESSSCGTDFLALLARDWEGEAVRADFGGIRTVNLRFGVILSAQGGALPRMLTPFKFGLGGRLGSGKQWMSWIALEDCVEIIRSVIGKEQYSGPLNVVGPHPVRNEEFTSVLAAILHRPAIFSAPPFALRMALGEMADSLVLASQRVSPERLLRMGFPFKFQNLEPALRTILDSQT